MCIFVHIYNIHTCILFTYTYIVYIYLYIYCLSQMFLPLELHLYYLEQMQLLTIENESGAYTKNFRRKKYCIETFSRM